MRILFVLAAVLLLSTIQAAPKPAKNEKRSAKTNTRAAAPPAAAKSPINHLKRNINPIDQQKRNAKPISQSKRNTNPIGQKKRSTKTKRQFPDFFHGDSVYPTYYIQNPSPLFDFQNSFLQAVIPSGVQFLDTSAFLKKQNLTDAKALPLDANATAAFEAAYEAAYESAFGDKNGTSDLKARFITYDGQGSVNIVNPFLLAKDFDGKGLPSVKAGKAGDANSSFVSLVNPYHGGHLDPVFGPELAPRYEIHYHPASFTLDPLPPYGGVGPSIAPAAVGPLPQFGLAPSFNTLINPYPYPYPFLPAFDPKSLKPNGKSDGSNKPGAATEQPTETSSQSYPENSEATSPATYEASSESTSEASAGSEAPQ